MPEKSVYIIANPKFNKRYKNGIGRLYEVLSKVKKNVHIIDLDFLSTNMPEKGTTRLLIVAGGDGTLHRVINTIPKQIMNRYIFGLIHGGTANEFAKAQSIPTSLEDSAKIIANPKNINMCHLACINNETLFLTGLLYGIADYTLRLTPQKTKNKLGHFAFQYGALRFLFKFLKDKKNYYKNFEINEENHNTNYLLINNASLNSKDINTEELSNEDLSMLSMVFLKSGLKFKHFLNLLFKNIVHCKILDDPNIVYSQHKKINLKYDDQFSCLLDGEKYSFDNSLEIKLHDTPISVITK